MACPQLLSPLQQETFCKPDSLALVATAGLGRTNIALNMAWDYANTIKTISKSVFFAACVMEKHRAYVMGIRGKTRYRTRSHTRYSEVFDIFAQSRQA